MDARLNKKDISACAYIYWGSASPETYDFEEANIIIPLEEEKDIEFLRRIYPKYIKLK